MPLKSKECFSSPKDKKRSKKRQQLKATNCEQNNIMDNNLRIAPQNFSALQIQVIS
jgi:cytochrome c-type biogenesis protein CcmH/NrfF